MAAYFLVEVATTDPALMAEYRTHTPGLVAKYGGRFVVRGGRTEAVEGDWRPERIVMLEYPDMAALHRFYRSADYAPVLAMRLKAGRSRAVAAPGEPSAPTGLAPSRAFLVVDFKLKDPAKLAEYRERVPALVAAAGGRYLVRSDAVESVEGEWRPERLTIVGFPDFAALQGFYRSDAYRPLLAMRLAATEPRTLLVEGV